jgi:hypothetical protein
LLAVLFLPEFKGHVLVAQHVFQLEPAQEECHKKKVGQQERPVDFNVGKLKAT